MRRLPPCLLVLAVLGVAFAAADGAPAEQSGGAGVRVTFKGSISPKYLPRHRSVPIKVNLSGSVHSSDGSPLPPMQRLEIGFGARGALDAGGLPTCSPRRLRNATRRQALARCRSSLVGRGEIVAEVPVNRDRPLLVRPRVYAFNGRSNGRRAIWLHAYAPSPPVSFVLPLYLRRLDGAFGIQIESPVRRALGSWPRLRSFEITLGRRYRADHRPRSYLSARCPLPPSFTIGIAPIARATYLFAPRPTLTVTIQRGCRVRR